MMARQGLFTISHRDENIFQIKIVRVFFHNEIQLKDTSPISNNYILSENLNPTYLS